MLPQPSDTPATSSTAITSREEHRRRERGHDLHDRLERSARAAARGRSRARRQRPERAERGRREHAAQRAERSRRPDPATPASGDAAGAEPEQSPSAEAEHGQQARGAAQPKQPAPCRDGSADDRRGVSATSGRRLVARGSFGARPHEPDASEPRAPEPGRGTSDVASLPAPPSSTRNFCAQTTTGRQRSWSSTTIISAHRDAPRRPSRRCRPCATATLMYEPSPGRRKSSIAETNASLIIRKNQPPGHAHHAVPDEAHGRRTAARPDAKRCHQSKR